MAMTHAAGQASALGRGEGRALFEGSGWPLIVFIWAIFAVVNGVSSFPTVIDKLSTDDAMRLVEVKDLLAGQSWWDLVQHRLNPPGGVLMHWSRVIDLPIALLLAGFRLVFAEDAAVRLAVIVWPALLLLPTLFACASASRTLAGPAAAVLGAFMMVMSPGVTVRFAPGAIDHHGAQIALAVTLLACALKLDRSRAAAVGAGVCAAVMTAIGIETAPHVVACAAIVALRWALSREKGMDAGAAAFGLAFALATALVAVLTLSPANWLAPVCDTLGVGHIAVAAVGGAGLAIAARLTGEGAVRRLAALGAIGAATAAALYVTAPNCFSSPFDALPEKLRLDWLARVQEAQPFFVSAVNDPTAAIAMGLPLFALICVAVWATVAAPREQRWKVATSALMCAAAVAITLWQIRGASLAFALGGPLLPAAVLAIGRNDRVRTLLALGALSPAALALVGLGVASAVKLPAMQMNGDSNTCTTEDYRALSRLPNGLVLNTNDTGPFILAFSSLSVTAAPYHRNVDGLMAELEAFEGSDETARAVALSRNAAYVVVCPNDGGVTAYARAFPDSFSAKLLSAQPPKWLEPVDLGSKAGLKAFRVLAGR